jgi:hypothetical protein
MAGKNEVTLTFAGDHDQLTRSMSEVGSAADRMQQNVGQASDRMQGEAKELGQSFDRAADATDTLDTRSMGFRDTVTGVQDAVSGFSDVLKGDLSADALVTAGAGVGDLSSGMTNFLIPSIKNAVTGMGNARTAAVAWTVANRGLIASTGGVAAILAGVFIAVQQGVKDFQAIDVETDKLAEDLVRLAKSGRETGEVAQLLSRDFGDMSKALELVAADAQSNWLDRNFIWAPAKRREVNQAVEDIGALDQSLVDIAEGGGDSTAAFLAFADSAGLSATEVADLRSRLPGYADAAKRAAERTRELAGQQGDAATETLRHADSIKAVTDALKAQTDPLFAFTTAVQSADDARTGLNEAEEEFGRNSPEYEQAALDLAQAELDLLGATSDVAGEIDQDLLPTLERMRDDGHLSAEAFDAIVASAGLAKDAAEDLDGTRARVFVDTVHRTMFERAPVGGSRQAFHTGGTVPGAPGTEMLALVQAGERIAPVRAGGDGAALVVTVQPGHGPGPDAAVAELVLHLIRTGALQLHTSTTGQVVAA